MAIDSRPTVRREAHGDGVDRLPRLLDVESVSEVLGVSVRHVRRLVAERRIPFIKWGRYLRFDPTEVEAWIDDARIASYDPRASVRPRSTG